MTIIGRVTPPSVATPVMPVSIGSPVIGIVEPPLDLSVEIPVGSVKDLMNKFEPVIERFLTYEPRRFPVAKGRTLLQGVIIEIDNDSGKAIEIERVSEPMPALIA